MVRLFSMIFLFATPFFMGAQTATPFEQKGAFVAEKQDTFSLEKTSLSGLSFRSIGPAVTSGRVIDIDVNPSDPREWYVASAHGSLWKTTNAGVTFSPIFDGQATFPMGAVTLDPSNPHVVWVGTGENNAHSYVIPGEGVFKSEDGGKTWVNKGLKESQQIGEIVVHPTDSKTVWVASYGPHRQSGGERGVFKTTDGGETWKNVLHPSDYTGCWELHMDPRNPDVLYTVAHQRQRYLTTIVTGGDESGIYKSTDGGETWNRLKGGLPQTMVGRIGMDISPVNPDVLFAVVDAKENKGTYKSTNAGASWTKVSDYTTSYAFYCQKLVCDPVDINRVYGMDIFNQVSIDGGVTWKRFGEDKKHVDNHALWIDPADARHMLSGCDGGVYETFDRGKAWDFKANLPIAECYKVTADNAKPFYNVYIGTQDNNSLGGPSRTINSGGISNADWYFTLGGDGFETQVDWMDPNIVYSQSQFGNLTRYDKRTGERLYLRSFESKGEEAYRFDWDAALLISRHDHKRLYHGGNKVLRSDDRGESWREISPDLTRGVPKELHHLMGRSWSIDEMIAKSSFAHVVTIAESPLNENILYAGSGDGLLHYTHDGGKNWKRARLDGLPEFARIHQIIASAHDTAVAYAACHDFFAGNFKPYLYKTTNGGETWKQINANLPVKGVTYTIGEDHVDPNLLFVGTMYGVFVSNTPAIHWVKMTAGLPASMCVMDLDIQRDENDLVVSSFGRGVFILDNYSPFRQLTTENLSNDAVLFPIEDGLMFIEADPLGFPGVGFQGASYFTTPNPKVGAVITYYIKEAPKSMKDQRNDAEKKLQEAGSDVKHPSYETLKKEAREEDPFLLFTISDLEGQVIRKIKQPLTAGVQRVVWDFRTRPVGPVSLTPYDNSIPWNSPELGYMVAPGNYLVTMFKFENGELTPLGVPQSVTCRPLHQSGHSASEQVELDRFNKEVAKLSRAISAADAHRSHLESDLPYLEQAMMSVPVLRPEWMTDLQAIKLRLEDINEDLNGDGLLVRYEGQSRTSLKGKVDLIIYSLWSTTSATTGTFERAYADANNDFEAVLADIREVDTWIKSLEQMLEQAGAPYTPGRFPEWQKE
ncbi:MAG: glycosyl hydrolase [Saprospiraceae bacterium]|nr:glycosyl hydrolase [Saprospiraceae bacterium]